MTVLQGKISIGIKRLFSFISLAIKSSLVKSYQLVFDHWWQTFIAILLPSLIWSGINLLDITGLRHTYTGPAIFVITGTLVAPLIMSIVLVQYNNLKLKRPEVVSSD